MIKLMYYGLAMIHNSQNVLKQLLGVAAEISTGMTIQRKNYKF